MRALSELGLSEIAGAATGIHSVHRAISDRVFSAVRLGVGPVLAPIKALHDGITDGVYATVATLARTASTVAAAGAGRLPGRPPSETERGAAAIGVVLALIGDQLEREGSVLAAAPVTVRVDGRIVHLGDGPPPPGALRVDDIFDGAGGRVAVLLHGLAETEHAWCPGGGGADGLTLDDYGVRLAVDLGITPVYVRYNSGRHVSSNGADLACVLARLVDAWPVEVTDITLIGHSMGGLLARSAVQYGRQESMAWPGAVGAVVSLGSPRLGAPLERAAHYGGAALTRLPETAALARLLARRSDCIRDLRGASLVDEDWTGREADVLVAAVDAQVPLGRARHLTLLRSDRVYEQLLEWLTPRAP